MAVWGRAPRAAPRGLTKRDGPGLWKGTTTVKPYIAMLNRVRTCGKGRRSGLLRGIGRPGGGQAPGGGAGGNGGGMGGDSVPEPTLGADFGWVAVMLGACRRRRWWQWRGWCSDVWPS